MMAKAKKGFFRTLLVIEIFMFIAFSFTNIYAKYVFQEEICVAELNIDRTQPKIELVSIQNTDLEYKNFANKTHKIVAKIKIVEKNLNEVFLDSNHIKIKINGQFVDNANIEFGQVQDKADYKIFDIQLSNLEVDGNLKLVFTDGLAVDNGGLKSIATEIATDIVVDNSIPIVSGDSNEFLIDEAVFGLN